MAEVQVDAPEHSSSLSVPHPSSSLPYASDLSVPVSTAPLLTTNLSATEESKAEIELCEAPSPQEPQVLRPHSPSRQLKQWFEKKAGLNGRKLSTVTRACSEHLIESVQDLSRLKAKGRLQTVLAAEMLRSIVEDALDEEENPTTFQPQDSKLLIPRPKKSSTGDVFKRLAVVQAPAAREAAFKKLETIYSIHDPRKKVRIPVLLDKYQGREMVLVNLVKSKYAHKKPAPTNEFADVSVWRSSTVEPPELPSLVVDSDLVGDFKPAPPSGNASSSALLSPQRKRTQYENAESTPAKIAKERIVSYQKHARRVAERVKKQAMNDAAAVVMHAQKKASIRAGQVVQEANHVKKNAAKEARDIRTQARIDAKKARLKAREDARDVLEKAFDQAEQESFAKIERAEQAAAEIMANVRKRETEAATNSHQMAQAAKQVLTKAQTEANEKLTKAQVESLRLTGEAEQAAKVLVEEATAQAVRVTEETNRKLALREQQIEAQAIATRTEADEYAKQKKQEAENAEAVIKAAAKVKLDAEAAVEAAHLQMKGTHLKIQAAQMQIQMATKESNHITSIAEQTAKSLVEEASRRREKITEDTDRMVELQRQKAQVEATAIRNEANSVAIQKQRKATANMQQQQVHVHVARNQRATNVHKENPHLADYTTVFLLEHQLERARRLMQPKLFVRLTAVLNGSVASRAAHEGHKQKLLDEYQDSIDSMNKDLKRQRQLYLERVEKKRQAKQKRRSKELEEGAAGEDRTSIDGDQTARREAKKKARSEAEEKARSEAEEKKIKATKLVMRYFQAVDDRDVDQAVGCFHTNYRVILKANAYGAGEPPRDEILSGGIDHIRAEHENSFRQSDGSKRVVDECKAECSTEGSTSVFVRYAAGEEMFEVTYVCDNEAGGFTERQVHKIEFLREVGQQAEETQPDVASASPRSTPTTKKPEPDGHIKSAVAGQHSGFTGTGDLKQGILAELNARLKNSDT